jgi:putative membrane protein
VTTEGGFIQMISRQIRNRVVAFASAVLLIAATASFAQMNPGQSSPGQAGAGQSGSPNNQTVPNASAGNMQRQDNSTAVMVDRQFVKQALQGGMAEVQLGQLASQKASSPDVKQFGEQMVADHTKLGDQMKPVAQQLGVLAPKDVSKKDKELMAKLQQLSGTEFDNAYITAMVKDHKKDVEDFKNEMQQTQNPELKQVVQQGGEVIDHHLAMIDQIAQSHNLMTSKGKLTSSGH